MKKQLSFVFSLSSLVFFAACGDETTKVIETTGMSVIEKGAKIPNCTADNEGDMIYATDSSAAYYCADGEWLPLKGEKGEQGKQGNPGDAGESCTAKKLKNGEGYKIVCGGDSVGVVLNGENGKITEVTETKGMSVVEKDAKIPACAADNVGEMIYLTDSAAVFFCAEGKWLSLKGERGEQGKQGEPGDAGKSCTAEKLASGNGFKITCGGDSVGVLLSGVDGKSFVDGWMVDPRDKQLYKTVTIGNQVWMAENLNYAYIEPTKDNGLDSSSFCDDNEPSNCAKFGRLYIWSAVMDSAGVLPGNTANGCGKGADCLVSGIVRGVCPMGWHLPDSTEWETLLTAVGGKDKAGTALKSVSGWKDDGHGADTYSFNAVPAGYRNGGAKFDGVGGYAYFWGAPLSNRVDAYGMHVDYDVDKAVLDYLYKNYGRSVRCLKDSE